MLRRVTPDIDGQLGRREVARVRCGGREHETPAVRLPRAIRRPQPRATPTDAFSVPRKRTPPDARTPARSQRRRRVPRRGDRVRGVRAAPSPVPRHPRHPAQHSRPHGTSPSLLRPTQTRRELVPLGREGFYPREPSAPRQHLTRAIFTRDPHEERVQVVVAIHGAVSLAVPDALLERALHGGAKPRDFPLVLGDDDLALRPRRLHRPSRQRRLERPRVVRQRRDLGFATLDHDVLPTEFELHQSKLLDDALLVSQRAF